MNGMQGYSSQRRREQALSRILIAVAAVVLFCGLFAQITLRSQISNQSKQLAAIQKEIDELDARAGNLDLNINQRRSHEEITKRAIALGMSEPEESQLRVLMLPVAGDTSTQTVAVSSGEEMNG